MNNLKLSEQEREVIRDVQRKNFYGRALPLGIGGMLACQFLIKRGSISSSRPLVKVFAAGFGGYLLGKMSVPSQVKEELLKQCPDGIFARMNNQFEKLSPEERKAFVSELYGNAKNKPQGQINETSPGVSSMSTRSEPSTETRDPLFLGSSGSTGSPPAQQPARDSQSTFSYAEQRSKYSNTETGIPQPPPSSRQPEFSYAQQRALNSGGSIQPVPTIQQDTQPPQPTGLSNPPAGTGKKVKRNIYGDEMD